jgi:hypothetical protein
VWNASAHRENDRADSAYVWDRQLDEGATLAPFATDDAHYGATDLGDAWTMVHAADRSREAVVAALRAGHVYASNGPAIVDVARDGEAVEVRCSPARDDRGAGADRRRRDRGARRCGRDRPGAVLSGAG